MSRAAKRVLVVDDDPLMLRVVKDRLAAEGFEVATTSSAFEATHRVEETAPDVVLIDVDLPALSGARVAALIRDRIGARGVRVLLYSSTEESELKALADEAGADGYLVKSDDYALLVRSVRRLATGKPLAAAKPAARPAKKKR